MNNYTYIIANSIISSLGFGVQKNMDALYKGKSGVAEVMDTNLYPKKFMAAVLDTEKLNECFNNNTHLSHLPADFEFTRFEKMAIVAMAGVFRNIEFPTTKDTLFLLSTTKGNVDVLQPHLFENFGKERSMLWKAADVVRQFWGFENLAQIISNACVSGVEAVHIANQMIKQGYYKHAVIVGADILTEFVVSGFMSFQSLSTKLCKPFDKSRDGLNLGEGAACLFLSSDEYLIPKGHHKVVVSGGASSNDANHISGPSRTGDGQFLAIASTMKEAGLKAEDIDYVSAHGTATSFNDEMESKSLTLAGLNEKPIHSLKAYLGHTLGAAGLIESIIVIRNLIDQTILKSLGYTENGVPMPLNIIQATKQWPMKHVIKTASGFGGANAAVIFSKLDKK
ncbi:MAG: hypothetical protein KAH25_04055 [Bacteroidales bacterium]|nr:hypothetical protein [Bacteroidales bacterium]